MQAFSDGVDQVAAMRQHFTRERELISEGCIDIFRGNTLSEQMPCFTEIPKVRPLPIKQPCAHGNFSGWASKRYQQGFLGINTAPSSGAEATPVIADDQTRGWPSKLPSHDSMSGLMPSAGDDNGILVHFAWHWSLLLHTDFGR